MLRLLLFLLLPVALQAQSFGISPNRLIIQDNAGDRVSNITALRLGSGVGYTEIDERTLSISVTPGGASQTPWLQDTDGAGFDLSNVGDLTVSGAATIGLTATFQGAQRIARTVVSAATYVVGGNDYLLGVTRTTTGSCAITLPPISASTNRVLWFVDEGRNAQTNAITIQCDGSDTFLDGTTTLILDIDGESVQIYCTGATWSLL